MHRIPRHLHSFAAPLAVAGVVLAAGATAVIAQRSAFLDEPRVGLAPQASAEDSHAEMVRLFGRVERRQREIDEILRRARQPSRTGSPELAGLLKDGESRSHEVLEDIDRILLLAGHSHPGGGT